MAGMFSNNNGDFSWNSEKIFDNLGVEEKRQEYLRDLSGTGNKEREMASQIRELNRDEMIQILHQIPEKADREDYIKTYLGVGKY
jgi:hypothetical protein